MLNIQKRPALFGLFVALCTVSAAIWIAAGTVNFLMAFSFGIAVLSLVQGLLRDEEKRARS